MSVPSRPPRRATWLPSLFAHWVARAASTDWRAKLGFAGRTAYRWIKNSFFWALQLIKDGYSILWALRAPVIIVVVFAAVTQLSGQLPELILGFRQMPRSVLAVNATALTIYVLSFFLLAYSFELVALEVDANPSASVWKRRFLISLLVGGVAVIPAFSMWRALIAAEDLGRSNSFARVYSADFRYLQLNIIRHSIGVFVGMLILSILGFIALGEKSALRFKTLWLRKVALFRMAPFFAVFMWLVVFYLIGWQPERIPAGGAIFFIGLFFCIWTILFITAFYIGRQWGVPVITVFLVLLALVNIFDLNDHHFVSMKTVSVDTAARNANLATEAVDNWMSKRDPSKPIYIIAAQGGGIYAAYHAALVVAHLAGPQHDLRNDILAISAVSGGSVGSAVALALIHALDEHWEASGKSAADCDAQWRKQEQLLKAIDEVFHVDYASTLLVSAAYIDTFLGLWPIHWLEKVFPAGSLQVDRATYLEEALLAAVSNSVARITGAKSYPRTQNLLDAGMNEYRSRAKFAPFLVFNVVSAETGDRNFIAPSGFEIGVPQDTSDSPRKLRRAVIRALSGLDLSLITSAVLSSRFPFVTPPGSLKLETGRQPDPRVARIVDGGYFDNSGVATASDIIEAFDTNVNVDEAPIKLLVLRNSTPIVRPPRGFNDLVTPIQAMLLTRVARGEDYIDDATLALKTYSRRDLISVPVTPPNIGLTLGWFLSASSLDQIRAATDQEMSALTKVTQSKCLR